MMSIDWSMSQHHHRRRLGADSSEGCGPSPLSTVPLLAACVVDLDSDRPPPPPPPIASSIPVTSSTPENGDVIRHNDAPRTANVDAAAAKREFL